jgi:hypothetical protein
MKNYLIKGLHKINSTKWWPGRDRADEGDLFGYYTQMAKLSEASFLHNLQGDWEYIKLESSANDVNHVFRQQFRAIWDIWSAEPCNILYCGSDTQALKPVEVFGRYQHFLMFNHTDPRQLDEYPNFLNADIRYYPAEMNRAMFEQALVDVAQATEWNNDQKLYNRMVWSQGLSPEQVIDPTMAYQGPWIMGEYAPAIEFTNNWNGCKFEDAKIVHWHGSRNAQCKLDLMKLINQRLDIPETPVRNIVTTTIDISHLS